MGTKPRGHDLLSGIDEKEADFCGIGPGEKILGIPLIVDKLMSMLDFEDLKNCRLSQKMFLEARASASILKRGLTLPIPFIYHSGSDTFVLKKSFNPNSQNENNQMTIEQLTLLFEKATSLNHNFPCTSFHFYCWDDTSSMNDKLSNFFEVAGPSIQFLSLDLCIRSHEHYLSFRKIIQVQCPNLETLVLSDVDYHWDDPANDKLSPPKKFEFHLPALKYFYPQLNSLERKQGPFSVVGGILKGAPNLCAVRPFYLKFTQLFLETGHLAHVQECCFHVDGGASTCWDMDPESDGYESFHGNFDSDFENFVHHSEKCKVQLKRFRIWVSHWALVNPELNQSAHIQWQKEATMTLLTAQRHFLTQLGDIPLSLLLRMGDQLPVFPNLKFLSIRQLPLATPEVYNSCRRVPFDFCLETKFPKLFSVRFVQMQRDQEETETDEQEDEDETYENYDLSQYQLRSVRDLEIRFGCRADCGHGISQKKLVASLFPCVTQLSVYQTDDFVITLTDIYETFSQLETLCLDGVFLYDDFVNLDPILTGFSDQHCQQLWQADSGGGSADLGSDFHAAASTTVDVERRLEELRTGPSLLCLKKLKLFKMTNVRGSGVKNEDAESDKKPFPFSSLSVKYAFKMMPNLRVVLIFPKPELRSTFDSIAPDVELVCRPNNVVSSSEQEFWNHT